MFKSIPERNTSNALLNTWLEQRSAPKEVDASISFEDVERGDLKAGWLLFNRNDWWEARTTFLNAKNNGICDALTLLGLGFSLYETGEKTGLNFLIEAFGERSISYDTDWSSCSSL